jgi:hypothetical protein
MECKRDYQQSVRLLEAILQVSDESQVEEEDRRIIKKCNYCIQYKFYLLICSFSLSSH